MQGNVRERKKSSGGLCFRSSQVDGITTFVWLIRFLKLLCMYVLYYVDSKLKANEQVHVTKSSYPSPNTRCVSQRQQPGLSISHCLCRPNLSSCLQQATARQLLNSKSLQSARSSSVLRIVRNRCCIYPSLFPLPLLLPLPAARLTLTLLSKRPPIHSALLVFLLSSHTSSLSPHPDQHQQLIVLVLPLP